MATIDFANPYLGPSAFEERHQALFFGRDHEAETLEALVVSEEIVLFYAPSGAGKTSLVQARLVPELRKEGWEILLARSFGARSSARSRPANVYVFNALVSLRGARQNQLGQLEKASLRDFLEQLPGAGKPSRPRILILDQFEEILTAFPERRKHRADFFHQIAQAIEADPRLTVLLVMREDFIAGLDEYTPLLPDRLRTRFGMTKLRHESAVEAARRPAEKAGRPFEQGVAERLVDDLRRELDADRGLEFSGEFVEPVQLQVVCHQLWRELQRTRPTSTSITAEDLAELGKIDNALERFYDSAVRRASGRRIAVERRIRDWFERALITSMKARKHAARGPESAEGLDNSIVEALVDEHLIRAAKLLGGTHYELIHDRLIAPILKSNQDWSRKHEPPFAIQARHWEQAERDSSFLLEGKQLDEARAWASRHADLLTQLDSELLEVSVEEQTRKLREKDRARRSIAVLLTMIAVISTLAFLANRQANIAESQEKAFDSLRQQATDPQASLRLALEAARQTSTKFQQPPPVVEDALREALRLPQVARIAAGLAPSTITAMSLDQHGNRLAILDFEGYVGVWDSRSPQPMKIVTPGGQVTALALDPEGKLLATADVRDNVAICELSEISGVPTCTGRRPSFLHAPRSIFQLSFSKESEYFGALGEDGAAVWSTCCPDPRFHIDVEDGGRILSFAFGPLGRYLATGHEDGRIRIWNANTGTELRDYRFRGVSPAIRTLAFSEDENRLVFTRADGTARVIKAEGGDLEGRVAFGEDVLDARFASEHVLTLNFEGLARVWPFDSHQLLTYPSTDRRTHEQVLVAFSFDGHRFAVCKDTEITIWELITDEPSLLAEQNDRINAIAFDPASNTLASAGEDGTARLYRLDSHGRAVILDHPRPVNTVAFSPDGRFLATGAESVRLWETATGLQVPVTFGTTTATRLIAFSLGDRLATVGLDSMVRIWNADSGELVRELSPAPKSVTTLAFSPDGGLLLAGGTDGRPRDGQLTVWNASDGRLHPLSRDLEFQVLAAAFSADGETLALAGGIANTGYRVQLWRIDEPVRLQQELADHQESISSLALLPGGAQLISGSLDGVRFWEIPTGRKLRGPEGLPAKARYLSLTSDATYLAVADTKRIWIEPLRSAELVISAEKRLNLLGGSQAGLSPPTESRR